MSAVIASPSSLSREIYVCKRTLILADGSSMLSLMGMGTRSTSLASSTFSSSRTKMYLNSSERANNRRRSISHIVGRKWSLYVEIVWWVT